MDKNQRNVILVIAILAIGLYAADRYGLFSWVTPPPEEGAVAVYGSLYFAGNSTPLGTVGSVSAFEGAVLVASDSVSSGAWDMNLNPGTYTMAFEGSGYYCSVWTVTVPGTISGTRTYNAGAHGIYLVATSYTMTFANSSDIVGTKTQGAQSDVTLITGTTVQTYTFTVTTNTLYSSMGLPSTLDYPGRESVFNYLVISLSTTNVVSTTAQILGAGTTRLLVVPMSAAIATNAAGSSSVALDIQFTAAGSYTMGVSLYSYTNISELETFLTGHAPDGFTLGSYGVCTSVTCTIS